MLKRNGLNDGRSKRKAKSQPFITPDASSQEENLRQLIEAAKEALGQIPGAMWSDEMWQVTGGRLLKLTGKNVKSASLAFAFAPKLGGKRIESDFAELIKALVALRFARSSQSLPNQRTFIAAASYVAHASGRAGVSGLLPSQLDEACKKISEHYGDGAAYNLHKAVAEFASHCDVNGLCKVKLDYKYAGQKRPDSTGGFTGRRLDDAGVFALDGTKMASAEVYRMIGALHGRVPVGHPSRLPLAVLTILASTGLRFSECANLALNCLKTGNDGAVALRYFKGKASSGRTDTPLVDRWLTGAMSEIVRPVVEEMALHCADARGVAREMRLCGGPDLRFLENVSGDALLGQSDLAALELPAGGVVAWARKNGYLKRINGEAGVTLEGVTAYCKRDYHPQMTELRFVDQHRCEYYLDDLLFCRPVYLSQLSKPANWVSTAYSHAMLDRWLDTGLVPVVQEYAPEFMTAIDFTSHAFRHTVNTLLDEGGLPELLQTDWFGRKNPRDTKAYQHTSQEQRVLSARADVLSGRAKGRIAHDLKFIPITLQESYVEAKIRAVHDVGPGACIHDFSQLPCERHLQCTADCADFIWTDEDEGRDPELKRSWAMTKVAQKAASDRAESKRPRKSSDWVAHNTKKLMVLDSQLAARGIAPFDPEEYLQAVAS